MSSSKGVTNAPSVAYVIPDDLCKKAGINATWMAHDKLGIYAYQHVPDKSRDCQSTFAPCSPVVHHVSFDSMLFDPILRKLVNESSGVFIQGQNLAAQGGSESECRQSLLTLSRQYRSIVRACLENAHDLMSSGSKEQNDKYKHFIAILYNIELVWHLCEILYVDVVRGDAVLPQLMEWVRFHFPQFERRASAIFELYEPQLAMRSSGVENIKGAEEQSDYWDVVVGVLLQGRIDATRALLQIHSAADSNPFSLADRCLRTMPLYNVYGGISVSVFNSQWNQWQADVRTLVEDGHFVSNKKLEFIMKIMAGDEGALDEIRPHCETWYQLMTAVLFFTEPTVKSFDLSFHADQNMVRFGVTNQLRYLDDLIMALLEADLQKVILELQNTAENGWFAAHLTNLLFLCGRLNILDSNQVNVAHHLKEHVVLDYGTTLMGHHSLWQVGVSYLDHCSDQGLARLDVLLCTIPLTSETRALKIIDIARKRKLHNVVTTTCKVMARKSMQRNRLGNALTWALRSHDVALITHLGNLFLDLYLRDGKFASTDLLENLGSCMLVSDRLTFLGKFCEFHQLYRAGELKAAGSLLVSLLASKLPPKSFQITLLMDALPLIEAHEHEVILSSNDTYVLMSCLEDFEDDWRKTKTSDGSMEIEEDSVLEEKLKLIRLGLARNLSRSSILEETETAQSYGSGSFEVPT